MSMSDPPAGFRPHDRSSPLTEPWEPLFSRKADNAVILGLRAGKAHTNSRGFVHGGLIGAFVFRVMQDVLGNITPQYWQFWLGIVLLLLVLFVRGGLLGLLRNMRDRYAPNLMGPPSSSGSA